MLSELPLMYPGHNRPEQRSLREHVRERSAKRKRRLSAKKLSAFWAALEPLAWGRLTDASGSSGSTDMTFLDVYLRHGNRRLGFKCYGAPPEP